MISGYFFSVGPRIDTILKIYKIEKFRHESQRDDPIATLCDQVVFLSSITSNNMPPEVERASLRASPVRKRRTHLFKQLFNF